MQVQKIRVLVVDDDRTVRRMLAAGLQQDPTIEVVGEATDPYNARDKIVELQPDVMTLDVEMPRMNGLDFLRRLMPQYPLAVIMVSSLTEEGRYVTLESLKAGALDFVAKPGGSGGDFESMILDLRQKVQMAARVDIKEFVKTHLTDSKPFARERAQGSGISLIVVGASTGGTQAFSYILERLPENTPGILVVQHMAPGFTGTYANTLNKHTLLEVKEAETLDLIMPGRVLVAPGNQHMAVKEEGNSMRVNLFEYEKVNGHRPSVDVTFNSVAESSAASSAIGVLLTGMGKDGARGLLSLRRAGARTIAQDEKSSIVYGMPQAARELDAVEQELSLEEIPGAIMNLLESHRPGAPR
ncbi:MAG TPA: chemotaxis response regulator protein-glutamate methylesterase [Leptospiraceae bacterium]|nr:chemotaxis response regulator protein-glutamate methylesterase [Spirochaetaceae bacterium]HBS03989.1 chemotaxis response regulator protein-glutamate methylesterase [Leptospiraceae bacterium]